MKEGSKYQALLEYLRCSNSQELTLAFAEIESLLNSSLPDSARTRKGWWSNRRQGALQACAWIEAGYRVEYINLEEQCVTFRKLITNPPIRRIGNTILWSGELIKALRSHMGLTQTEFALRVGVRQATVSDWEKGIHEPSRAISKHLSSIAEQERFQNEKDNKP